jgi:hypothetical protein
VRGACWLLVLAGCRQIFGLEDPVIDPSFGDAHNADALSGLDGSRLGDADGSQPPSSSFVQGTGTFGQSGTSAEATFGHPQVGDDLDLVVVAWTAGATVVGVTDNAGNTFKQLGPTISAGAGTQAVFYCQPIHASASNTVTVSFDSDAGASVLSILEYRGLSTTALVDASSIRSSNGTAVDIGPDTTTHAPDVVVGICSSAASQVTPGPLFTSRVAIAGNIVEDLDASVAGSYDATATLDTATAWTGRLIAFAVGP